MAAEAHLYGRLGREFEILLDDSDDYIADTSRIACSALDDPSNGKALEGKWGVFGVNATLVLMGENCGGGCAFRLREVIAVQDSGDEGEDEDEDEEEGEVCDLCLTGTWARESGSLQLSISLDMATLQLTGVESAQLNAHMVKTLRTFLDACCGQVKGHVSTDPNDGTPFAVVLLMMSTHPTDSTDTVTPWIFNSFSPGDTSLEDAREEE